MIVLGGGPIGVELGQAFARLGSRVTIIEADKLLNREDPEAADVIAQQLVADGVSLLVGAKAVRVENGPVVVVETAAGEQTVLGSHLLIAVGRRPSIAGLNLEAGGVASDRNGVVTDRSLRTSNRRVFAVGDVAGRGQFTHLAGAHASLFVRKALFGMPINADALIVPRVTYCDPELASVGLSEAEARSRHGQSIKVVTLPNADSDRARAEGDTRGFSRLITTAGGRILGATLVGSHAGEQIQFWVQTLTAKLRLSALTGMIAPYPTRSEMNKRLAGQWYAPTLFSATTRRLVSFLKHIS